MDVQLWTRPRRAWRKDPSAWHVRVNRNSAKASEAKPFARSNNVTFNDAWTRDFSHGEPIRAGNDQTMSLNTFRLQFLHQGQNPNAGGDSIRLPWRMGLLTQANSTC